MGWVVNGNIPACVGSKDSIPIEDFLENFWDYDKSPYVREKLGKKQSIHRPVFTGFLVLQENALQKLRVKM